MLAEHKRKEKLHFIPWRERLQLMKVILSCSLISNVIKTKLVFLFVKILLHSKNGEITKGIAVVKRSSMKKPFFIVEKQFFFTFAFC